MTKGDYATADKHQQSTTAPTVVGQTEQGSQHDGAVRKDGDYPTRCHCVDAIFVDKKVAGEFQKRPKTGIEEYAKDGNQPKTGIAENKKQIFEGETLVVFAGIAGCS